MFRPGRELAFSSRSVVPSLEELGSRFVVGTL